MQPRGPGLPALVQIAGYHEAGHALACLWQGFWVETIAVYRHTPGAGTTHFRLTDLENPHDPASGPGIAKVAWQVEYHNARRLMRVMLAGPLAEAKAVGRPLRSLGSEPDLVACKEIVRHLYRYWQSLPQEAGVEWPGGRMINTTRDEVRRWLRQHQNWERVRWAGILLARLRKMSGDQLAEMVSDRGLPRGQRRLGLARHR